MNTEKRDFDKAAASWDQQAHRIKLAKDVADAITSHVPVAADMDMMDFGCGTGLLTLQLQPLVHSVTGVDSSQGMIDKFTEKVTEMQLRNVRAVVVDLDRGDHLTGSYDLIVSNMTLHHIRDIRTLFAQLHDVLAPSGCLALADLDLEDGQFHPDNTGVFHFGFDRADLRRIFDESGFGDVRDLTATTMTRKTGDGEMRDFAVFLMTGRRI
jgi:predicted TPR repeat methyltransferase